jgi:hypothetical protein
MFDLDWLRVGDDYCVHLNPRAYGTSGLIREQKRTLAALDGKPITLPADKRHHPSMIFLVERYSDPKNLCELRAEDAWLTGYIYAYPVTYRLTWLAYPISYPV